LLPALHRQAGRLRPHRHRAAPARALLVHPRGSDRHLGRAVHHRPRHRLRQGRLPDGARAPFAARVRVAVSVIALISLCALPAGAILWEPQPGQFSMTVIVKATFSLIPGEIALAPEQDPLREERHWDDNVMASVHWPGDFVPSKRRVDVMLVGHAYTPRGEP